MFDHERARAARLEKGVTATQVASAALVTERYVYRIEEGTSEPSYSVGVRIARFLSLEADDLFLDETREEVSA